MRTVDIVRLVRSKVAPDRGKHTCRSISMHGNANGGAIPTVRGKRCEKQYEPEREGLPAHAATLNDCAGDALLACAAEPATPCAARASAQWKPRDGPAGNRPPEQRPAARTPRLKMRTGRARSRHRACSAW